jgi:hypothetical protein
MLQTQQARNLRALHQDSVSQAVSSSITTVWLYLSQFAGYIQTACCNMRVNIRQSSCGSVPPFCCISSYKLAVRALRTTLYCKQCLAVSVSVLQQLTNTHTTTAINRIIAGASVHTENWHIRVTQGSGLRGKTRGKALGFRWGSLRSDPRPATADTLGATPRSLTVHRFDLYHDLTLHTTTAATAGSNSADSRAASSSSGSRRVTFALEEQHDSVMAFSEGDWELVLPPVSTTTIRSTCT